MALNPTPTYSQSSVSGGIPQAVPEYGYFTSGNAPDAYPANPGVGFYQFGFLSSTLVITNESANDLVYQFLSNQGSTPDNGVVKANTTLVLRGARTKGLSLRNRAAGQVAAFILTAF